MDLLSTSPFLAVAYNSSYGLISILMPARFSLAVITLSGELRHGTCHFYTIYVTAGFQNFDQFINRSTGL